MQIPERSGSEQPDDRASPPDRHLERGHRSLNRRVRHPYLAGTFQGTFSDFEARLSDGVLRGTAEVGSVQVKDPNLEAHLQSPDFFDAARFPQLSFDAHEVSRSGDELTIAGELTLKGHTEAVEI